MGCTASKLENEDSVRRCKERRRFMKDAVFARHHLAAAHADYCRSLRLTGSALFDFAQGEPLLVVSPSTPSVLLPRNPIHNPKDAKSNPTPSLSSKSSIPPSPFCKPPPPIRVVPPSPAPSSIHRPPPPPELSPTIASSNLPHILSASSVQSYGGGGRRKAPKLPHILSDSSVQSTPRTVKSSSGAGKFDFNPTYVANSTYSETPSQASSVWNWENFYPPSPPESEFFNNYNFQNNEHQRQHQPQYHNNHHLAVDEEEEERESEREEVHCSEWGDHYSTTSSDTDEGDIDGDGDVDGDDERETRSEISELRSRSHFGSSSVRSEPVGRPGPPPASSVKSQMGMGKLMGKLDEKSEDDGVSSSSASWKNGREVCGSEDMKIVVRHKDLKEIVFSIKDYFDMAAAAGDQVSEMLETGRAQLDRSFQRLKKTVYHSSGVFSNLSSSWTSKPPLAVKYRLDSTALDEPGVPKSLCSTLERLLAWEKKLHEEVKLLDVSSSTIRSCDTCDETITKYETSAANLAVAREGVKIEHEKKLATLQSQEYKGEDEIRLDKTKASIKKLQSLIIVTSQAANTTSSAIVGLRDSDLIPQLVELCHGSLIMLALHGFWGKAVMMYMWRSMNQFHEVQNQIVQQVRGLVNQQVKGDSTSELHRQATRDLESAVSAWHSSFCRLIKYQRDFIRSLHEWFKRTLVPVDKEATHSMREHSDAFAFLDEWKLALDRLPDTVASEAIKSFVNVVHVISFKQAEELKIKKRTESISKELEKKASALRNIEKKYYHSYSMVGLGFPDNGHDSGQMLDARDPLAEKKAELAACQRKVEDEILKHTKAVEVTRAMTLNNIQTGLPGVFQALTSFSSLFTGALEATCNRSYTINREI
ncbi:hypothetical protein Cgig2_013054 [Carnegiea gigantea]|uniref:Uncharacterized protein n=1 Tax=Carnegiea gigantea TaxID=171969 RepID=A0A9Q1KPZ7_9CARY|nr:hypothetical protein Cgig2_013054 [Carnegiea gigantea]